ncbi:MAG: hypothetical protein JXA82_00340 [Sedimentisphaerales bacterium]|nr:hypothetical protein [Sedimentisphaerales bacterium]
MKHVFVGFGFGPIQAGLFVNEAFQSGNFSQIVVAEIDPALVDAVRKNNGRYCINVAQSDGILVRQIEGVQLLNPTIKADRMELAELLSRATEIVTSLPSVSFYNSGDMTSVASLISAGLKNRNTHGTIVYTAENNNHAAEILDEQVNQILSGQSTRPVQYLNTVIGKMSQVVTDPKQITQRNLAPIAPGLDKAFLVEQFNRILVTRTTLPDFLPGIRTFLEKDDLLPFEEAKLYGHNAIHALLAYLAAAKGYEKMPQLRQDSALMQIARDAFLNESGAALIRKNAHIGDALFTPEGYQSYAEDLLDRMTNPYLDDTVQRAARDPLRKLGLNDRLYGTMQLALEYGIIPNCLALGAVAGVLAILKEPEAYGMPDSWEITTAAELKDTLVESVLLRIWKINSPGPLQFLVDLTCDAVEELRQITP